MKSVRGCRSLLEEIQSPFTCLALSHPLLVAHFAKRLLPCRTLLSTNVFVRVLHARELVKAFPWISFRSHLLQLVDLRENADVRILKLE